MLQADSKIRKKALLNQKSEDGISLSKVSDYNKYGSKSAFIINQKGSFSDFNALGYSDIDRNEQGSPIAKEIQDDLLYEDT